MFISVRKSQPKPAQQAEPVEDEVLESEESDDQEHAQQAEAEEAAGEPLSFPKAYFIGVRNWLTWCNNLIGTTWTYTVHVGALWAMGYYSLWIAWAIALGLTLAVLAFMPRPTIDHFVERLERTRKKTPGKAAPAAPEQAPTGPPTDPLVDLMWKLIGDAAGVHLKTLTEALAQACEKAGRPAPDKAAVRASLEARNIPLRPSVRDTRGKVNKGVHREDLEARQNTPPPPETPAPEPAP